MKCQNLVVVVLRLLALYWLCLFAFGLLSMVGAFFTQSVPDIMYSVQIAFQPIFYGTLGFLLWIYAEPISHRVVGHTNPELNFKEITAEHLYTLGILGFGIYHAASHLPSLLNMLHYQIVHKKGDAWVQGDTGFSTYNLTNEFFAFAIGVALVIFSPLIARKITIQAGSISRRKGAE